MPDDAKAEDIQSDIDIVITCAFDCSELDIRRCRKCNRPFCIMHSNHISPNFCKDCFKDVAIIIEKYKRTFDEISDNGQLRVRVSENTRYYLDGPDWPFVTPWINSLTDDELREMWVFHHFIMRIIETENDTRKIERYRKLREYPVPRLIGQTKTVKVAKVQQPETPESIRAKLKKQGVADNIIDMMIAAMSPTETKI